jgi:hypothetical protein
MELNYDELDFEVFKNIDQLYDIITSNQGKNLEVIEYLRNDLFEFIKNRLSNRKLSKGQYDSEKWKFWERHVDIKSAIKNSKIFEVFTCFCKDKEINKYVFGWYFGCDEGINFFPKTLLGKLNENIKDKEVIPEQFQFRGKWYYGVYVEANQISGNDIILKAHKIFKEIYMVSILQLLKKY